MASALTGIAGGTASGAQPNLSTASTATSEFDAAQQSLGFSSADATMSQPGVSVASSADSVTAQLGDFKVTVTADSQNSDTTVLENGARVMTLLSGGESSASFTVDLPADTTLQKNGDGYYVVAAAGETRLVLGEIHSPWAVDANGKKLPTAYSLDGNKISQSVQTNNAVFPIVADPTITVGAFGASDGPGVYWNMTGTQATTIAAAATTVLGLGTVAGCAAVKKVPVVGGIAASICGAVGIGSLKNVYSAVSKIIKSTKVSASSCYQIKIAPLGNKLSKVSGSNCS
jgi:hypothetical protein